MTPEIAEIVGRKDQPSKLTTLCDTLKDLVKLSRDEMRRHHDQWDRNDMVFRGERKPDMQDKMARQRGEPEKIILPLTFGQVMTFTAFGHAVYNQRDFFYEMIDSGAEDAKPGEIASALLEQNLKKNKFRATKLVQLLVDIARFGVGITKETWVHQQCPVLEEVVDEEAMAQARAGMIQVAAPPMKKQVRMTTKYMGNKVVNVSPYRWFPDPRLPLSRWSEGEFCADEIEEPMSKLRQLERDGVIAGLEHIPQMADEAYAGRRLQFLQSNNAVQGSITEPSYALITEIQVRLNPATTEIDDGVVLNPDLDYETIYVVWIANDGRIIRLEEAGYDHEEFGWNAAQFLDDQSRFINFSLAEMLTACQDTATWFINSRITSVRKSIFNQLAVDPAAVEVDDIIQRRPIIRLKPSRAGSGIDNWVKQIQQSDVTQGHLNDIGVLSGMSKEATGINETLLGQFSPGRRSAKEAGNVANHGAQRLLMIFATIWESCLEPQGSKMLSNLRQGLDEPTMVKVYGQLNTAEMAQPDIPGMPAPLYRLINVTKADLLGNYDLAPMNGTTPSQRAQNAAVLKEILDSMQKDPRMVLLTGLDPKLLFFEVLSLLNIRNVQRFRLTPERLQQLTQLAQPTANGGGAGSPQGRGGQPQSGGRPSPSPARPGRANGAPPAQGAGRR